MSPGHALGAFYRIPGVSVGSLLDMHFRYWDDPGHVARLDDTCVEDRNGARGRKRTRPDAVRHVLLVMIRNLSFADFTSNLTVGQIASRTGLSTEKVRDCLRIAREAGLIVNVDQALRPIAGRPGRAPRRRLEYLFLATDPEDEIASPADATPSPIELRIASPVDAIPSVEIDTNCVGNASNCVGHARNTVDRDPPLLHSLHESLQRSSQLIDDLDDNVTAVEDEWSTTLAQRVRASIPKSGHRLFDHLERFDEIVTEATERWAHLAPADDDDLVDFYTAKVTGTSRGESWQRLIERYPPS